MVKLDLIVIFTVLRGRKDIEMIIKYICIRSKLPFRPSNTHVPLHLPMIGRCNGVWFKMF